MALGLSLLQEDVLLNRSLNYLRCACIKSMSSIAMSFTCEQGLIVIGLKTTPSRFLHLLIRSTIFLQLSILTFLTYTSIPHVSLKQALRSLIQEEYEVRDNIFLIAETAYWSDNPSKVRSRYSLTEEKLMELVEYLIDNVFVSVGNRVYKQCVGIPMGTDCAPLLANLFL